MTSTKAKEVALALAAGYILYGLFRKISNARQVVVKDWDQIDAGMLTSANTTFSTKSRVSVRLDSLGTSRPCSQVLQTRTNSSEKD